MKFSIARSAIDTLAASGTLDNAAHQHYEILGSGQEVLKALFGVGFIGFYDRDHGTFIFSHDGKKPDRRIEDDDVVMVHPCYWPALNLGTDLVEEGDAEEIFDEYEVKVTSEATEQRKQSLGRLMEELRGIPLGIEGAAQFEDWCKRAIEIAFAKQLSNIQLRPNGAAAQRRDIVGTNQSVKGFWKRVREDYGTRQVIFEIKNYESLGIEEFRQAAGYLGREYGKIAFIVCRDPLEGLTKGGDLEAFREFYSKDGSVVMKIPAVMLCSILSKLRNPEKFDSGNAMMEKLIDTYIRMYAVGQTDRVSRRKQRSRG